MKPKAKSPRLAGTRGKRETLGVICTSNVILASVILGKIQDLTLTVIQDLTPTKPYDLTPAKPYDLTPTVIQRGTK
jgi:hypothetical protein